ncbi:hypothetical protein LWI29_020332 [Acer saccharum]|uniref:beta-ketoacyl-[acyl-carrier-protein] synthase I n=1 Tax=Acer saccharum TaxID=4024 RepID=A0AA39S5R9_ACESA|nr:hypothetical protein LWI29_020332 [Acer saccharum]
MGSALLAIDLGFIGPNYSSSTACAPSNYCFYAAANHIRRGEADMMIAGGTEAAIIPIELGVFVACRALAQRNNDKIVFSILGIFTQLMVETIDLGVVIEAHIAFLEFKIVVCIFLSA